MKKELNPYDYYYESSGQSAMMVANGHPGLHPMHHPYNLEDNFLHILGKNQLSLISIPNINYKARNKYRKLLYQLCAFKTYTQS